MAEVVLVGRFEVDKRIGRGGMAEVFLSKDLLFHRPAAVEVLREGNTNAQRGSKCWRSGNRRVERRQ